MSKRVYMNLRLNYVAFATSALVLSGCGGGTAGADESSNELSPTEQAERVRWKTLDSTAPTLDVTSVSEADATGKISVAGTAADDKILFRVRWSNDLGGNGTATLASSTRPP